MPTVIFSAWDLMRFVALRTPLSQLLKVDTVAVRDQQTGTTTSTPVPRFITEAAIRVLGTYGS